MNRAHLILILLWLAYCLLHSLLAWAVIKERAQRSVQISPRSYRLFYNLFSITGLAALLAFQFSIHSFYLFANTLLSMIAGSALLLGGAIIMLICIKKYFLQLSGLRQRTPDTTRLETEGIHRYVRHPLYSGTFLFLAGAFLIFPLFSNLLAVAIIILYTIVGIIFEERKLEKQFGNAYRKYRQEVPMLIPFLK